MHIAKIRGTYLLGKFHPRHYFKAVVVVRHVLLRPVCSPSIDMSVLYTASEVTVASLHIVGGARRYKQVDVTTGDLINTRKGGASHRCGSFLPT